MPKTPLNRPLNCKCIHYSDLEYITDRSTYKVQIYCKSLNAKGQLWIYNNLDTNFEYLPDVIYPSITSAANNANASYWQMGVHYGKTNKRVWGVLEKYVKEDTSYRTSPT